MRSLDLHNESTKNNYNRFLINQKYVFKFYDEIIKFVMSEGFYKCYCKRNDREYYKCYDLFYHPVYSPGYKPGYKPSYKPSYKEELVTP